MLSCERLGNIYSGGGINESKAKKRRISKFVIYVAVKVFMVSVYVFFYVNQK